MKFKFNYSKHFEGCSGRRNKRFKEKVTGGEAAYTQVWPKKWGNVFKKKEP